MKYFYHDGKRRLYHVFEGPKSPPSNFGETGDIFRPCPRLGLHPFTGVLIKHRHAWVPWRENITEIEHIEFPEHPITGSDHFLSITAIVSGGSVCGLVWLGKDDCDIKLQQQRGATKRPSHLDGSRNRYNSVSSSSQSNPLASLLSSALRNDPLVSAFLLPPSTTTGTPDASCTDNKVPIRPHPPSSPKITLNREPSLRNAADEILAILQREYDAHASYTRQIVQERDAAIQERNVASTERDAAVQERDTALDRAQKACNMAKKCLTAQINSYKQGMTRMQGDLDNLIAGLETRGY